MSKLHTSRVLRGPDMNKCLVYMCTFPRSMKGLQNCSLGDSSLFQTLTPLTADGRAKQGWIFNRCGSFAGKFVRPLQTDCPGYLAHIGVQGERCRHPSTPRYLGKVELGECDMYQGCRRWCPSQLCLMSITT